MTSDVDGTLTVRVDPEHWVTVNVDGSPTGFPVFLLHGTPGSRTGPRPRSGVLYRQGVKLISYDRPGYGGSVRRTGRTVASAAADVAAIADRLGIERFSVAGRSGGGPHALACAALLPERVIRTLVMVSVAPPDADGLDWFEDMTAANVADHTAAREDPQTLIERLSVRAVRTRLDPDSMVKQLLTQMGEADRRVVTDVNMRSLLNKTYAEAFRQGPDGWIDDVLAMREPWGFKLQDVSGPVRLWHGVDDQFSPFAHSLWLAGQLPRVEVQLQPGTAHFGAMEILPQMFPWLTELTREFADAAPR